MTITLAPMAGITDRCFRALCFEMGCTAATTEMISAQGYITAKKTVSTYGFLTDRLPEEGSLSAQIFGTEPVYMAKAAEALTRLGRFTAIDINMGCPARKVTGGGSGSALMLDLPLAGRIIRETVRATELPVTVKMRLGWDAEHICARELAMIAEEMGAAGVTVHGRTREQMYSGRADHKAVAQVKKAVSIPVIANGDVWTGADAVRVLEETHCDGVAVGRGALGNPWIFREISCALKGENDTPPACRETVDTAMRHARMMADWLGERFAVIEMRKHFAWYLKGKRGAAQLRTQLMSAETLLQSEELLSQILKDNEDE